VTTTAPDRLAEAELGSDRVGFGSLLRSEWTKLRSVRSTVWSLTLLVVLTIGLTAGLMALIVGQWGKSTADAHHRILTDPVSTILGAGAGLGQVPVIVLGVLVMASEYSTGMIRSSLLAVPRRLPMLWAKCLVFATVVLVVGEVTMFPSFLLGAAILHSKAAVSLSDPGVLQAVIGAGLYFAVLALFSLAIGGIVRHTAGAIAGAIAFVVILAPLAMLLPGSVGNHIYGYLPTVAGTDIRQAHQASGQVLSAWQGFGVFCLWTAILLAVAAYVLKARDA
jgi:ABC-type transport system involved in multi-copper enzyme maturation permease subunit